MNSHFKILGKQAARSTYGIEDCAATCTKFLLAPRNFQDFDPLIFRVVEIIYLWPDASTMNLYHQSTPRISSQTGQ